MAEKDDLLDVWVDDHLGRRHVGVLERVRESGRSYQSKVIFHYDSNLSDSDAVSLTMPVRRQSYEPKVAGLIHILPPIFDQNLPEGTLRAYLTTRYSKLIEHMGDFDLLKLVGGSSIGRVRVMPLGQAPQDDRSVGNVTVKGILADADSSVLLQSLFDSLAEHSGVSGVQPKVLAEEPLTDVKFSGGRRITLTHEEYIVKSSGEDYPWLAINEHLCMYAAMMSQLNAVSTALSDDGQTIAIKRFDRNDDGSAMGFEDMCTLSGLTSNDKYKGSYERMVMLARRMVQAEQRRPFMAELFRSIALSSVIGNGDAHLKNFGLIYKDPTTEIQLAPAYDIVSSKAYLPNDALALSLLGLKNFPARSLILRFGQSVCSLSKKAMQEIFDDIQYGVESAASELAHYAEAYPGFGSTTALAMHQIWERGLKSVLGLQDSYALKPLKHRGA